MRIAAMVDPMFFEELIACFTANGDRCYSLWAATRSDFDNCPPDVIILDELGIEDCLERFVEWFVQQSIEVISVILYLHKSFPLERFCEKIRELQGKGLAVEVDGNIVAVLRGESEGFQLANKLFYEGNRFSLVNCRMR